MFARLRFVGHEVHLLVHPDVVIDVGLFVDAAGRHREQAKGDYHLLFDAGFFGFPVSEAVEEGLEGLPGTFFGGHFVEVTFGGDEVAAVEKAPNNVGADDFLS